MKIHDLATLQSMIRTPSDVERHESSPRTPTFSREMSQLSRANCEQKLGEMHGRITEQGQLLSTRCDMLELKRYKEMVAEFMHEAVRFAFEFRKQSTLDARGRHKLYALIKRVNQKLEELTRLMLSVEAENLAVMATVDELRGLLLDMYM